MKIKLMAVILCVILMFASLPIFVYSENDSIGVNALELNCVSAVLMEASTGKVLYEKNADEALPPASVTKIMTLLLVMEAIDSGTLKWDDTVTASAHATSMGGSQIYLKEGEQMTVEDMVKSVVIASANDAAVALAEHIAGSEEVFVSRMNERAKQLGMNNTKFENTNGLDDTAENHVTSARDIAIMSRELIKHEKVLEYSSTWMDSVRNGAFGLTNTNRLVRFYRGCTGLKTGSTSKAKFCISATAKRDGMSLIAVIMASPTRDERNNAAKTLLDWGYANYELYQSDISIPQSIGVLGGETEICRINKESVSIVLPKGSSAKIKAEINIPQNIKAPVGAGQVVGNVKYMLGNDVVGEAAVYSERGVGRIGFFGLIKNFLACFLLKK